MVKSVLKIITNEKGNSSTKTLKYSTTDPETVQVKYSIDGADKVLLGEISYGTTLPPEPTPDKPPVVEAGEDVTVKQGTMVTIDGSAKDDGTITSIQWLAPDGITLIPTADPTNVQFQAPLLLDTETFKLLQFILVVEDEKGHQSTDGCVITVVKDVTVPPIPPIPPKGLIYDSITNGKWDQNRVITDFDPLFPKPFVGGGGITINASGANKKLVILNGVATFSSGAGHPRWYLDSNNYNTFNIFDFRFLDTEARNFTQQKQSRHNMGGELENKFGGFNHEIDIEGQKVGSKIELWHTGPSPNHIEGGDSPLPKKLDAGQWIGVKNTDEIKGRKVDSKTELNYGNEWVMGHQKEYDLSDSKYDFIFNEQLYRTVSAEWFRMNPNSTSKGFEVKNLQVFQI